MSLVILSHAGEDTEAAKDLAHQLRLAGLNVWLDVERLRPGDHWMEELAATLRQASAMVVYIGKAGVQCCVDNEIRAALDKSLRDHKFRLIPVLGPGADPDSLPFFLKQHQWQDFRHDRCCEEWHRQRRDQHGE